MSGYNRKYGSIEQSLQTIIDDLRKLKIDFKKEIGRSENYLRKCSDESIQASSNQLNVKDAITIDKLLLKNKLEPRILETYKYLINKYVESQNIAIDQRNIPNLIWDINDACQDLLKIVRESIDPKSDQGEKISNREKTDIYKNLTDIEAKISELKLTIGQE